MKKALLILGLAALFSNLYAQEEEPFVNERITAFKVGIAGGPTFSDGTYGIYYNIETEKKLGLDAGMTFEYDFSKNLGIELDLFWLSRGYTIPLAFSDDSGAIIAEGEERLKLGYFGLPLMVKGMFGKKLILNVSGGICPAVRMYGRSEIKMFYGGAYNNVIDVAGNIGSIDLSAVAGIGVDIPVGKWLVGLNGRYYYGLLNIFQNSAENGINRSIGGYLGITRKF